MTNSEIAEYCIDLGLAAAHGGMTAQEAIAKAEAALSEWEQGADARYLKALTPSADTKASYIGEFKHHIHAYDEDGYERYWDEIIPWSTIKDIMAAIRMYADSQTADSAPEVSEGCAHTRKVSADNEHMQGAYLCLDCLALMDSTGHVYMHLPRERANIDTSKPKPVPSGMMNGGIMPCTVQAAPNEETTESPDLLLRDVIDYAESGKVPEPWMVHGLAALRAQLIEVERLRDAGYRQFAEALDKATTRAETAEARLAERTREREAIEGFLARHSLDSLGYPKPYPCKCDECIAFRAALDVKEGS